MTVILIGLGPQGLFLMRELSRKGYSVIALGEKNEIGAHSKYGRKILIKNREDLGTNLRKLESKGSERKECYITSGFYLSYLASHHPELWKIFDMKPSPYESVKLLINKLSTYELADSINIKVLNSDLFSDIDISEIDYPVIAKWNEDIHLFSKPGFKTAIIENMEQAKQFSLKYSGEEKKYITVQRYLGDNLDDNISYGGYYKEGECLAGILVQQKGQYPLGLSSYVKEYCGEKSETLIEMARNLFMKMKYTGFGEAEFKYDRKTGSFFLLEVNPRTWGWIKILKQKYPDIADLIAGKKITPGNRDCKWVNILRNIKYVLSSLSFHSVRMFFESINGSVYDVWDTRDMKPFFYQIIRRMKN